MDVKKFFNFMTERHRIYLRRKEGFRKPWTKDPILQQNRFCNVFRELDTTTIWIRENIREPYADHHALWFMLCIARQINWVPTLQALMEADLWPNIEPWTLDTALKAADLMRDMKASGQKIYTGAYMLTAHPIPGEPRDKPLLTCKHVLGNLWDNKSEIERQIKGSKQSLQQACDIFQPYYGWGPFMAYEVVTDMRHTRYLERAQDIKTWANPGPGAKRGLNRLMGRELRAPLRDDVANIEMKALLKQAPGTMVFSGHIFEMRDIEHSLCEFDKYERVRCGTGSLRARYDGRK